GGKGGGKWGGEGGGGKRQPEGLSTWSGNLDLWHKEIMVGRKRERFGESHIELDLFTGYWSIPARHLPRLWMDAARLDRIKRSEATQVLCRKGEITGGRRRVAIVELYIRGRIHSARLLRCRESGWPAGPANIRVVREHPVNLDPNLA